MTGFGLVPEGDFMSVPRGATEHADNQGQFGLAFRWFSPMLNDMEFGAYFINYHSRLPIVSVRTGSLEGAGAAGATQAAAEPIATAVATHLELNPSDTVGAISAGTEAGIAAGASADASQAIAGTAATGGDVAEVTQAYATDAYAQTANYHSEYPEYIQMLGLGFNTTVGNTGIALQGEFSYRWDMPLQVDDTELFLAALSPLTGFPSQVNRKFNHGNPYDLGTDIPGFIERDVSQFQVTGTKLFGPTFGADQLLIMGEAAMTHIHNMPDKDKLRLEAPGTYVSADPTYTAAGLQPATESNSHFADATSWGYVVLAELTYNNAIGAVNLIPRLAWQHDVNGISPMPIGNFLENRKALTFGLGGTYLNAWSADLSYTIYWGAGSHNLINDRDFVAASIKYSF